MVHFLKTNQWQHISYKLISSFMTCAEVNQNAKKKNKTSFWTGVIRLRFTAPVDFVSLHPFFLTHNIFPKTLVGVLQNVFWKLAHGQLINPTCRYRFVSLRLRTRSLFNYLRLCSFSFYYQHSKIVRGTPSLNDKIKERKRKIKSTSKSLIILYW